MMQRCVLALVLIGVLAALPACAAPVRGERKAANAGNGGKMKNITPGATSATGSGRAHVHLRDGKVTFSGSGTFWVRTNATLELDASYSEKTEHKAKNGKIDFYVYKGFIGTATVSGKGTGAGLRGENIAVDASGVGWSHFIGTGKYTADAQTGTWTDPATRPKGSHGAWWTANRLPFGKPQPTGKAAQ